MASVRLTTVKSEIHNVLSTVRLTDRSLVVSSRFDAEVLTHDERPVVRQLKNLHDYLLGFDDLAQVDAPTFLGPFLEIIRTPTSSGVVTGVVLSSLNKLLLYGSLTAESPRSAEAVNEAVEAVCNCRFEASHHYGDEVVLLQILEVLVSLLRCPVGDRLTEDNAWNLVQVCFRMAVDPSLSELLRAAAANHLSHVVLTVFGRVSDLIRDEGEVGLVSNHLHHHTSTTEEATNDENRDNDGDDDNNNNEAHLKPYSALLLARILAFLSKLTDPAVSMTLPSMDAPPSALSGNEIIRAMGLQLINIALETAGERLGANEECVRIIQNDLCKFLLSNSQTDDLPILGLTLRVVYNLFFAMKGHLKVQLEVFLTSVHFRIVDSNFAANEKKELALESLLDFCHDPSLVLDLHANYDCDVNCSNLFEGLCRLLCHRATPEPGNAFTVLHVLALEGVFSIVGHVASRCVTEEDETQQQQQHLESTPTTTTTNLHRKESGEQSASSSLRNGREKEEALILRKTHKRRLMLVAAQFNKAPCKPYWREYGNELGVFSFREKGAAAVGDGPEDKDYSLPVPPPNVLGKVPGDGLPPAASSSSIELLPLDDSAHAQVAKFLLDTPGLNKHALGEFLSDHDAFARGVLKHYLGQFSMKDVRVDTALRLVLECFRIPGEAQKIERVMESFSAEYFKQNAHSFFSSADAVFIFAFSIVLLHTDAHSRSITEDKRMTLEQFVKNVRGINEGRDLDPAFLAEVYHAVKEQEFLLSYDHATGVDNVLVGGEWDGVLRHSSKVQFAEFSKSGQVKVAGPHERDMFEILFEPTMDALDAALNTSMDGRVVVRSLRCAADLARVASFFGMTDEFNQVVIFLCRHFSASLAQISILESFRVQSNVEGLEMLARAEAEEGDIVFVATEQRVERERRTSFPQPPQQQQQQQQQPPPAAARRKQSRGKRSTSATATTTTLLSMVESNVGNPHSPVRVLLTARCILLLVRAFGSSVREAWSNVVRVLATLKSDNLLPRIRKDDLDLTSNSEDQRLLLEEKNLFESRKSRLLFPSSTTSPRVRTTAAATAASSDNGTAKVDEAAATTKSLSHQRAAQRDSPEEEDDSLSLDSFSSSHGSNGTDDTEGNGGNHKRGSGGGGEGKSSVWSAVTSFLFGADGAQISTRGDGFGEEEAGDWKKSKPFRRAIVACHRFFEASDMFLGLVRSTSSLSDESLGNLLVSLSSPFSDSPPAWCSTTNEFSPSMASAFLELLVLVTLANRSKLERTWQVLDSCVASVLLESDEVTLVQSAIACFFDVLAFLGSAVEPHPMHIFPATFDALDVCLGERSGSSSPKEQHAHGGTSNGTRKLSADANAGKAGEQPRPEAHAVVWAGEVLSGLAHVDLALDDVQGWKVWFHLLNKCIPHANATQTLRVVERIAQRECISRWNVVLAADVLTRIASAAPPTKAATAGVLSLPPPLHVGADDRACAVSLFPMLKSGYGEAEHDDAVWLMLIGTLKSWWGTEAEVVNALQTVLYDGVLSCTQEENRLRRTTIAFDRILFPMVVGETDLKRRSDAMALMTRFFLLLAGGGENDTAIVDMLLERVVHALCIDFGDPRAAEDAKESALQRLVNLLNVVVVGTAHERERLDRVAQQLDLVLPSDWRVSLVVLTKDAADGRGGPSPPAASAASAANNNDDSSHLPSPPPFPREQRGEHVNIA